MCILDFEQYSSLKDNNIKNSVELLHGVETTVLSKEDLILLTRNLYSSHKGVLGVTPMKKFLTREDIETLIIEFELMEYLFKTEHGRERMNKIFPGIAVKK